MLSPLIFVLTEVYSKVVSCLPIEELDYIIAILSTCGPVSKRIMGTLKQLTLRFLRCIQIFHHEKLVTLPTSYGHSSLMYRGKNIMNMEEGRLSSTWSTVMA